MGKIADQESLTPDQIAAIIPALLEVEAREKQIARNVVLLQISAVSVGAIIFFSISEVPYNTIIAVLGGGGISVINGAMLAWRMSQPNFRLTPEVRDTHAVQQQLRVLYYYAAERFLVVVFLLTLTMSTLRLSPLGVIGGFIVGQVTLLIARIFYKVKQR